MIKLSASGLNGAPCKNSVKGPDGMEICILFRLI